MLFGEGMGFSSWFATHPPILERIKAVDPSFDPAEFEALKARWTLHPPSAVEEDRALGFAADGSRLAPAAPLESAQARVPVQPATVAAQVGTPADDDVAYAGSISLALDDSLRALARRQDQAVPLVLALLLDPQAEMRARQLEEIATALGPEARAATARLREPLADLHPMLRLPLASLAFPLLRRRPRPELARILHCCERLIAIDGQVSLFEYCLGRLLRRQTVEALDPSRHAPSGRRKLASVQAEAAQVLAVLAQHGHADPQQARRAQAAGLALMFPGQAIRYQPPDDFVHALEQALPRLDQVEPRGKALLVEGLVATIGHDGRMTVAEAELLRTLCAVLHCPLPPVLEY